MYSMGLSHSLPFPVLWDLLAFRGSPGEKGKLERAVVTGLGSAVVPAGWLRWL